MTQSLLHIENATKIYGGGLMQGGKKVVALQNFNLTIPQNSARIVTIAGESGQWEIHFSQFSAGFYRLDIRQDRVQGT